MLPRPFRVRAVRRDLRDTVTFDLEAADGGWPAPFSAGQFNMIYAFGIGEVPVSISGDPAEPGLLVHTVKSVGAVTRALCSLKRGDTVGVRGPYGTRWPLDEAQGRDVLLVAGGIGLAPLRPALCALLGRRQKYGRLALLVGARSPEDLLYAPELERWRGRFDLEVLVTVDSTGPAWRGDVGVVTKLISRARFEPVETMAFVCGPEVMMRYAVTELRGRGVPADHIHVSMERNMKCGAGFCGHCQLGPAFVCKDGPVFRYSRVGPFPKVREV
jgi:NAD(P)H-flavin reductase